MPLHVQGHSETRFFKVFVQGNLCDILAYPDHSPLLFTQLIPYPVARRPGGLEDKCLRGNVKIDAHMELLAIEGVHLEVEVRRLQGHRKAFSISRKTGWLDKNVLILRPAVPLLVEKGDYG